MCYLYIKTKTLFSFIAICVLLFVHMSIRPFLFVSCRAHLSTEDDTFLILSSIVEPMTFQTDIRLALEPVCSEVQTDVSCKLEKVKCSMSQKDLQVVLGSVRANWSEGAPIADLGNFNIELF